MRRTRMTNGNKKDWIKETGCLALALFFPIIMYLALISIVSGCSSMQITYENLMIMEHKIHIQEGIPRLDCIYCDLDKGE